MKIIGSGVFVLDRLYKREYHSEFVPGKANPHTDHLLMEEIGGTAGNVVCMLAHLGNEVYPQVKLSNSENGQKLRDQMERYGCKTRFVTLAEGGTMGLMDIVFRKNRKTGEPEQGHHLVGEGGRLRPAIRNIRERDEAPALLAALDFVPDVYFFDSHAAGHRALAKGLRERGALVYYESEGAKKEQDKRSMLKAVEVSDIIKYSHKNLADDTLPMQYPGKVFIKTMSADGLDYAIGGVWHHMDSVRNENEVDYDGAGDWTTAVLIDELGKHGIRRLDQLTEPVLRECLEKAQAVAAESVSYLSSKGIITAGKI